MELVKKSHDPFWKKYDKTILDVANRYIMEPMITYPWEWKQSGENGPSKQNYRKRKREANKIARADKLHESVAQSSPMESVETMPKQHVHNSDGITSSPVVCTLLSADSDEGSSQRESSPIILSDDATQEKELLRSQHKWKSYQRRGSFLPGSVVDDLCLAAYRKFKEAHPAEDVVRWGIHHT